MEPNPIQVLLVEADANEAQDLREALLASGAGGFEVTWCADLAAAVSAIDRGTCEVAVLDLHLPDSSGLDTLQRVITQAPELPVVVLTHVDDEDAGLQALRQGAQDFLVTSRVTPDLLTRSLRHAIERHRLLSNLRGLAMLDDLTELYNRRGLMTLAEQHVKLAQRSNKQILVVWADFEGLKGVNDTHGHSEGDLALIETAELLRRSFRGSDLIARIGGDRFVVFALEPTASSSTNVTARLEENLALANAQPGRPYPIALRLGFVRFEPWNSPSLPDMIARVEEAIFESKHRNEG